MRSERPDGRPVVAVVGGGFSGTMAAVHLLARGAAVVLVERAPPAGRGVAYSTTDPCHLLNVRAGNMSALPGQPDHFARWAGVDAGTFVSRRDYAGYLSDILRGAGGELRTVAGSGVALERVEGRYRLRLASGPDIDAEAVVLAMGNLAPRLPRDLAPLAGSDRLVDDPWSAAGQARIGAIAAGGEDVLILGTGLTMVDVALSLDSQGYGGRIIAVSRRGLAPRAHAPHQAVEAGDVPGRLLPLMRHVRGLALATNWRGAVDSLRPMTQALWQGFTLAEKRRFLRHLRPWWDVHRHRIAPAVGERFETMRQPGRLEVTAGRLRSIEETGKGLEIAIAPRGGSGLRHQRVTAIVNCSGQGDLAGTADPLVQSVLESGLGQLDPLGLGFDVEAHGRMVPGLHALGPLTKGCLWEIVAVPDIRVQAEQAADALCRELGLG